MLNPQDLQRLIDIITDEVLRAQPARTSSSRPRAASVARLIYGAEGARRRRAAG